MERPRKAGEVEKKKKKKKRQTIGKAKRKATLAKDNEALGKKRNRTDADKQRARNEQII